MMNEAHFFLIVPPGLEPLAWAELHNKLGSFFSQSPPPVTKLEKGGIQLRWEIQKALPLNYLLKIPTNLLLRVDHFRCRDFPRLYQKIGQIPWRDWLLGPPQQISVSCHRSRIMHTQRAQQTVEKALIKYFQAYPPKKSLALPTDPLAQAQVLVRFQDDECTVSLACPGTRLSVRGHRPYVLDAPLRENLAAAIVYFVRRQLPSDDYALIDPMCGAGTQLLEAALFYSPNFSRRYHFEYFPILQNNPHYLTQIKAQLQEISTIAPFRSFVGSDRDPLAIIACQKNIQRAHQQGPPLAIDLQIADLLATAVPKLPIRAQEQKKVVVINPPYGKRLLPAKPLESFYQSILHQCWEKYSPAFMAITIPQSVSPVAVIGQKLQLVDQLQFDHGGLGVQCLLLSAN